MCCAPTCLVSSNSCPRLGVWRNLSFRDHAGNGSINLKEFEQLAKDGVLLHGSIKQYSEAFEAVDSDHDGQLLSTCMLPKRIPVWFFPFCYLTVQGFLCDAHAGLVTAEQLSKLFGAIGSKSMEASRIAAEFERYDIKHTGTIGFYEFLRMFRSSLLDLESVIDYLHQSPPAVTKQSAPEASVDGVARGEVRPRSLRHSKHRAAAVPDDSQI